MRPATSFCNWMTSQGLIFGNHPFARSVRNKLGEALLRVSFENPTTGEIIATPLNRPLQDEELVLPLINDALAGQALSRPLNSYKEFTDNFDFDRGTPKAMLCGSKRLYRQFAGADGRGGRLYGHWVQNIPGWLRRGLLIKGKPVAELDFRNMQLVLLYGLSKVPVPDVEDLYAMPGMPRDRDDMKMVLTLSVGNPTRDETLGAIRKRLHDEGRAGPDKAERLYNTFWACHEAVSPHQKHARDGVWAVLQNLDSRIALRILAKLLDQEITAIPVHDSFIVERRHAETTERMMKEVFAGYCPGTSVHVNVTSKGA
uniref:DNA-directed DNA polymerase family A palm domain-containing protein n=1 Tax=Alloyangia mangrovi TaxID=1779329 RepID=A0A2A3JY77_9RHOB